MHDMQVTSSISSDIWSSFSSCAHESFRACSLFIGWGAPSFQELLVILIIVLIVFGAKRLPEFARALGQSLNEFRKAKEDFEKELHQPAERSASLPCSDTQTAPPQPPHKAAAASSPDSAKSSVSSSPENYNV